MDTEKPATATEMCRTTTAAAIGDAALEDAIEHWRRQSFLDWLAQGGLPDLTGPTGPRAAETRSERADP